MSITREGTKAGADAVKGDLDKWAYAYATWRQGQRDSPRCEAPGAADIAICRRLIEEVIQCRPAAPVPPSAEGMVMVPRHPTEEMMQAGLYQSSHDAEYADVFSAWVDMVAVFEGKGSPDDKPAEAPPSDGIVGELRERAKTARSENTGTALGDALHFERAADEIERLQQELARFKDERSYVVGFNDGWDFATEAAEPRVATLREAERKAITAVLEERARYFERAESHRTWEDAARSYRATIIEIEDDAIRRDARAALSTTKEG